MERGESMSSNCSFAGRRLKRLRIFLEQTQEEFVRGLGISAEALSLYEKGLRDPSIDFLLSVSVAKGVNPNLFFNTPQGTVIFESMLIRELLRELRAES